MAQSHVRLDCMYNNCCIQWYRNISPDPFRYTAVPGVLLGGKFFFDPTYIQSTLSFQCQLICSQIPVFLLLILCYKIYKHGFYIFQWGPERSNDLRNAIQAASEVRKGRLEFPDSGFTKKNVRTFFNWVWVWMK
jgi:hypothetical protein